jgi:hypothetical protein
MLLTVVCVALLVIFNVAIKVNRESGVSIGLKQFMYSVGNVSRVSGLHDGDWWFEYRQWVM